MERISTIEVRYTNDGWEQSRVGDVLFIDDFFFLFKGLERVYWVGDA